MSTGEQEGGTTDVEKARPDMNHSGRKIPTAATAGAVQNDDKTGFDLDLPIPDYTDFTNFDAPDLTGASATDGSGDGRSPRQWWRGVRRFDGLGRPDELLAQIALDACLPPRVEKALRAAEPIVVVLTVPSPAWVKLVEAAIRRRSREAKCIDRAAAPRASAAVDPDAEAADLVASGRPVVAITPNLAWISPLLHAAADHTVSVPPLNATHVSLAVRIWCGRRGRVALVPSDLSGLDLPDVAAALRSGASPRACTDRIRRASRSRIGVPEPAAVTPLGRLTGYNEAHAWAMRTAADIARVRRGELSASVLESAVLYGPPGTGKTTLARSLAQSAGVICIETSVGSWFANSPGYLDSIVKQISSFCDRLELAAKQDGCAIAFVDEADAMPNRANLDDRSASWWQPVVTYWLLRVEGLRKAGVVLIAATNHLERMDAALLRPGRFDRQFLIAPPDEAGRLGILRIHLGDDLAEMDLLPAARLSHGMTGAVLAGCVRAARRRAWEAQRPIELDDLLAEIAPADTRPPAYVRDIALHEAGHAVIAQRLGFSVAQVTTQPGMTHEGATLLRISDPVPTRAGLERQVIGLLAGRAADAVLGGGVTAGASADLREATRLLAAVHASFGLGGTLRAVVDQAHAAPLLREDPELARLVEADLRRLQGVAEVLVRADRPAILALAEALIARRVMTGAEVGAITGAHRPRYRIAARRRDVAPLVFPAALPDPPRRAPIA